MTIDEYINEMQRLKSKSERLLKNMREAETPLLSPRDPLNLGDGIPGRRSGGNGTENRPAIQTGFSEVFVRSKYRAVNQRNG